MANTITCVNKTKTRGKLDPFEYKQCYGCWFLYTHLGNHPNDDIARCDCPTFVSYGDRVQLAKNLGKVVGNGKTT